MGAKCEDYVIIPVILKDSGLLAAFAHWSVNPTQSQRTTMLRAGLAFQIRSLATYPKSLMILGIGSLQQIPFVAIQILKNHHSGVTFCAW
jgi:hypothetical protein